MSDSISQSRRLSLPVAPHANARLRFAPDQPTGPVMSPEEALAWAEQVLGSTGGPPQVVISGPGDPLATVGITLKTIRLLKLKYPSLTVEIVTLGLGGEQYAPLLDEEGVGLVTLRVDAVDPEILIKLFAWIRPGRKTVRLAEAVEILLSEQAQAVIAFRKAGIKVKIRTTLYPGYNDDHVEQIAQRMAHLGAEAMTLVPFKPEAEEAEGQILPPEPDNIMLAAALSRAGKYLEANFEQAATESAGAMIAPIAEGGFVAAALPKPSSKRPNVAVVSAGGMEVDLHLGQAFQALIYGHREDGLTCLLGRRDLPEAGGGGLRWEKLADSLPDCFALLAASAGVNPKQILKDRGITVLITEGEIDGTVDVLFNGGKKKSTCRK
ncbi:MAG: radical SAM protein [Deltaproteobacteria bacterium]|nr:radical SAM protein [Deltaproteobacteria bacterium]